ncbi:hypothetical protein K0B96_14870 [Horticoccus luteus]|uniref:Secreted protein with PEP-CTERM sorting signal n=1 Tax=Horticoccus luteus TaxID=2862869 RepID=A0A8F9XGS9_9BACT|nr:hypothetical protein [Horticoccus luteus]QYM78565.1 hypothetical protein K0B96_14870 [Horticoccus luteus]
MKINRLTLLSGLTACLASLANAQTDYYANGAAGTSDNLNSSQNNKWTLGGTPAYVAANTTPGNVYHTNGWTLRAGRIGTTVDPQGSFTFNGSSLVIDDYAAGSSLNSNTTHGAVIFELASVLAGPRLSPATYTRGSYTVNLTTAPLSATMTAGAASAANSLRIIQASNGVTTINGSLTLNGDTQFKIGSSITDMLVKIDAPITGSGRIEMSGGSAGGQMENGFDTWAVSDMSGWTGGLINVVNKHTISFTNDTDFFTTNPNAVINFGTTSSGFLNLQADVSFGSGKVFINGTSLADGSYTVDMLNTPFTSGVNGLYGQTLTNGHISLFASEGANFGTVGTTYKLYVGSSIASAIPEPSTYAAVVGLFVLAGAAYRRRQRQR